MKQNIELIKHFQRFIKELENEARLKKNGTRLSKGTIRNYSAVLDELLKLEKPLIII